jgi:hypothetical protein
MSNVDLDGTQLARVPMGWAICGGDAQFNCQSPKVVAFLGSFRAVAPPWPGSTPRYRRLKGDHGLLPRFGAGPANKRHFDVATLARAWKTRPFHRLATVATTNVARVGK